MSFEIKKVSTFSEVENTHKFYCDIFKGVVDTDNPVYSVEQWKDRMQINNDFMLYVSYNDKVIGICFARLENQQTMIIGPLAIAKEHRGQGFAKKLMTELEQNAIKHSIKYSKLGAVKEANDFYYKLGYKGSLLIQSEHHTINELLRLSDGHNVNFTRVYDDKINQVCLDVSQVDDELEQKYLDEFPGAYTMMLFEKTLIN